MLRTRSLGLEGLKGAEVQLHHLQTLALIPMLFDKCGKSWCVLAESLYICEGPITQLYYSKLLGTANILWVSTKTFPLTKLYSGSSESFLFDLGFELCLEPSRSCFNDKFSENAPYPAHPGLLVCIQQESRQLRKNPVCDVFS